jgi:hypothetical protein
MVDNNSKGPSFWLIVPIGLFFWGASEIWKWLRPESAEAAFAEIVSEEKPSTAVEAVVELSAEDRLFVCRAAVAEMMGRDLSIVTSDARPDGLISTQYLRPSDGSRWRNLCKFEGERVVWATLDDKGRIGRWRDHPDDEVVTFDLTPQGVDIRQTFGDGSSTSGTYLRD